MTPLRFGPRMPEIGTAPRLSRHTLRLCGPLPQRREEFGRCPARQIAVWAYGSATRPPKRRNSSPTLRGARVMVTGSVSASSPRRTSLPSILYTALRVGQATAESLPVVPMIVSIFTARWEGPRMLHCLLLTRQQRLRTRAM